MRYYHETPMPDCFFLFVVSYCSDSDSLQAERNVGSDSRHTWTVGALLQSRGAGAMADSAGTGRTGWTGSAPEFAQHMVHML
jgi:hypothetical protein